MKFQNVCLSAINNQLLIRIKLQLLNSSQIKQLCLLENVFTQIFYSKCSSTFALRGTQWFGVLERRDARPRGDAHTIDPRR